MKTIRTIAVLMLVSACIGCTTIGPRETVSAATARTIGLFGSRPAGEIVAYCSTPLLFNQELLVREADIRMLISTISGASNRFEPLSASPVDGFAEFSKVFGDSFELRAFYENYVTVPATLVTVRTDIGEVRFLLGERTGEVRHILGVAIR